MSTLAAAAVAPGTPALVSAPPAPIQFFDLKAQQARIRDRLEARWRAILDHGRYIGGPEVDELEGLLARFTGAADCVAVGNGTDAIVIALQALGVGRGDAVFIPALTYNATANAVLLTGADPVFVDVEPHTWNLDPAALDAAIYRTRTDGRLVPKAVVAVDLYGLPADARALGAICARGGVELVIDAAQSFGGRIDGTWVGAAARVTTTSFYPSKALGGYGDGGAIFTTDRALAGAIRSIRWHGTCDCKSESIRVGGNGRLDSIQCAVVVEKMSLFEDELARRRQIAAIYEAGLDGVVDIHRPRAGIESGYGLFTVAHPERARLMARLKDAGVPTTIYYKQALHQMQAFAPYAPRWPLPHAETAAARVFSLPMHAYLTDDQARYVVDQVRAAAG